MFYDYNVPITEDILVCFLGVVIKASTYGIGTEELWVDKEVDFKVAKYLSYQHFRRILRALRFPGESAVPEESEDVSSLVPT